METIYSFELSYIVQLSRYSMIYEWTGLYTATRADVKKDLVVCIVNLEDQNLVFKIGHFLGPVTKR